MIFILKLFFYKDVAKAKEYVKEIYNEFLKKYGYSKNDVTWKLTSNGIGFSSSSENIGFDLEDYILDHMYEYGDYEFETDYELMESKTSARKSLKEDSLDDIIPMGHSKYFDTLVEFFKDNDVPIRISHTASGGKICYVENDMEFITVIFKSPKHGYELLKILEMYGDGSTYLSKGKGGAWYSNHVPLEEVYVWDIDKDEFVNYKGKVLKNIDYDDIVESKKNARKSIKESKETWEDIDGKFIYFKDDKYEIISQSNRYDYSHFEDVENWGFMILARKIKSKGNLETWAIFYGSETKFDYNYWDEDLAGETVDSYRSDAVYDIGSEDEIDEIWNEMN